VILFNLACLPCVSEMARAERQWRRWLDRDGSVKATENQGLQLLGVAWVCGRFSAVGAVLRLLSGEMAMGGVIVCVRRVQYLFS